MDNTEYLRPSNLKELSQIMAGHKKRGTVIAGGKDLVPQMRNGGKSPEVIVGIGGIKGFFFLMEDDGFLSIGAGGAI